MVELIRRAIALQSFYGPRVAAWAVQAHGSEDDQVVVTNALDPNLVPDFQQAAELIVAAYQYPA
jgi:phosphohistidine swiveling domain-containing protein